MLLHNGCMRLALYVLRSKLIQFYTFWCQLCCLLISQYISLALVVCWQYGQYLWLYFYIACFLFSSVCVCICIQIVWVMILQRLWWYVVHALSILLYRLYCHFLLLDVHFLNDRCWNENKIMLISSVISQFSLDFGNTDTDTPPYLYAWCLWFSDFTPLVCLSLQLWLAVSCPLILAWYDWSLVLLVSEGTWFA